MTLGLKGNEVKIAKPDASWKARFDAEQAELTALLEPLGGLAKIEHVGSTSVTNLRAKPIVDIAIGFWRREDVGPALAAMLKAGRQYLKWGNQPGMLLMASGNPREVFYHLVVVNSPAWIRLIQIRNQLQRFPLIAKEYEDLKVRLAMEFPDSRAHYASGKKAFLTALLGRGMAVTARQRLSRNKMESADRLQKFLSVRRGGGNLTASAENKFVVHLLKDSEQEPR